MIRLQLVHIDACVNGEQQIESTCRLLSNGKEIIWQAKRTASNCNMLTYIFDISCRKFFTALKEKMVVSQKQSESRFSCDFRLSNCISWQWQWSVKTGPSTKLAKRLELTFGSKIGCWLELLSRNMCNSIVKQHFSAGLWPLLPFE